MKSVLEASDSRLVGTYGTPDLQFSSLLFLQQFSPPLLGLSSEFLAVARLWEFRHI